MNDLGIAIDGGRYVRFSPDRDKAASAVRLQTLGIGADSARLDFVSFHSGGTVLRRSCVVRGLKRRGRPGEIRVHVRRRSRCVWSALIAPAGGGQSEIKIRTGRALWPFVVLLLIAVLIPASIPVFRFAFPAVFSPEEKRLETVPAAAGRMNRTEASPAAQSPESSVSPPPAAAAPAPEISSQEASAPEIPAPEAPASPVTVFFAPDSAFLDADAVALLDETVESLPDSPLLRVEGHCAAFGTEEGRIRLSRRRARAVADYLKSRLGKNVRIETEGFGVDRPVTEDPLLQNLNRRAEIRIEANSL